MKKTAIIIVVALLIIGIVGYVMMNNSPQKNCGDSSGAATVHYYDKDGNPICASQTASVVGLTAGGVRGVGYIDLTVKVSNDPASIPLFCDMVNVKVNGATGSAFDTSMSRYQISLNPGQTEEWTSNKFATSGFESAPTPDNFSVDIQCQYTDATGNHPLPIKTATMLIYIQPDGSGSFQVGITPPGGLPQQYCGDSACNNGETVSTCPVDCSTSTNSLFRTTDLFYSQGSAIAYTPTCGNVLVQYGYSSTSCWAITGNTCPVMSGYNQLLSSKTIPPASGLANRPVWASTSTPTCLYNSSAGLSVAFQVASTSSSPCTIGQWEAINYATSSSYKTNVDSVANTENVNKEVQCP